MKRIAVVAGGYSSEHIISIRSAQTIMDNISRQAFEPYLVLVEKSGWRVDDAGASYMIDMQDFSFERMGEKVTFDCAFIIIHGTPGEDGLLPGYFDMIGVPYTGCNHLASTLTFNKWACNTMLRQLGFRVADSVLVRRHDTPVAADILARVGLPCFVKPNDGGSSFGVSKVKTDTDLLPAIEKAFAEGTEVLIERTVAGTEITVGVYWDGDAARALPITEIVSHNEFFDFAAKYEGQSHEITPARLDPAVYERVQRTAEAIYRDLGLGGVVRIDMLLDGGAPNIIEINTVPGMSAASIVPQQAEKAGISLEAMISSLIHQALR
jgi:D-alanine-D-alanine ligase